VQAQKNTLKQWWCWWIYGEVCSDLILFVCLPVQQPTRTSRVDSTYEIRSGTNLVGMSACRIPVWIPRICSHCCAFFNGLTKAVLVLLFILKLASSFEQVVWEMLFMHECKRISDSGLLQNCLKSKRRFGLWAVTLIINRPIRLLCGRGFDKGLVSSRGSSDPSRTLEHLGAQLFNLAAYQCDSNLLRHW